MLAQPHAITAAQQPSTGAPTPPQASTALDPGVRAMLDAPYLTDDERRDLRIEHGVFTPADLDTPSRVARAALLTGQYLHPVLRDTSITPVLRAEAALRAGQPEKTLELLAGLDTTHAIHLRVEALYALGRFAEIEPDIAPLIERLGGEQLTSGDELAGAVRTLMVRARVTGSAQANAGDYRTLLSLITKARDELSPLSWRVRLAEAELLYEKHNLAEARQAAAEALARNPSSAETYALLGRMGVDAFDFDAAEKIAKHLDQLASPGGPMGKHADESGSPHAGLIRARVALRQRLAHEAQAALKGVLDRYGNHRESVALAAAAAAIGFDTDALVRTLARFEKLSPHSGLAHFETGSALGEARQYADAEQHLRKAIARQPNWSTPRIELGMLLLQAGDELGALDELTAAIALDPFNIRAANSLKIAEMLRSYASIESEHFIIRYTPADAVLASEMPAVLEAIHARVAALFDHEPAYKTVIQVMPDHASFAVRIAGMPKLHTMAAATGPVVALESPREGSGKSVGPYDWARVLQHEYSHTVTLSRTRNRIPHWFTEAAAVYAEGAPRAMHDWRLLLAAYQAGELFDLNAINTAFVRPKKDTDRPLAYAQGHWMYQFMVKRFGADTPLRLMDEYAQGTPEAEAYKKVLGLQTKGFLDEFLVWGETDLRAHGLLPPAGVPTLGELLAQDGLEKPTIEWGRAARRQYPEHPQLLLIESAEIAGRAGGVLGNEDIVLLEQCASACPVAELPHKLLVRAHMTGGQEDGAGTPRLTQETLIEHLAFLDAREQHSPTYASALAELHAELGQVDEAFAAAERATRIDPFKPALREQAARFALLGGRLDAGERHLRALAELEPDRTIHHRRLEALEKMREGDE